MISFLELCLLVLVFAFLYLKLSKRPEGLPPGNWGYPILGNLPRSREEFNLLIQDHYKKYGDIFSMKIGSRIMVFLTDFQLIKNASSKPELSGKPKWYSTSMQRLNSPYGIICSDGHIWESNRKFALKALNELGIGKSSLESIIGKEIDELIRELSLKSGEPTTLAWPLNAAILNVIWSLVASKRFVADNKEIGEIWTKMMRNSEILEGKIKIIDFFPWIDHLIPKSVKNKYMNVDELKENVTFLKHFWENQIDEHKKTYDSNKIRDYIDIYLLDLEEGGADLLEESFKKDMLNLTLSIMDFFIAGVESTNSTLLWFFLYICKYPEVQEKIHKEIDEAVGKDQRVSFEDRQRLPYLEATLCEVNRMVSLNPKGGVHLALEDTELGGFKIPKGTYVMACIELCHRNPAYFENPSEFQPERFLDSEGRLIAKEGYLPFSIGRRECLGESLARMELFLFTSAILKLFEVNSIKDDLLDPSPDINTPLANLPMPYKLIFIKRSDQDLDEVSQIHTHLSELNPEIITQLPITEPQIVKQVLQFEPQTIELEPTFKNNNTDGSKFEKIFTTVQSHEMSQSHDFEPQLVQQFIKFEPKVADFGPLYKDGSKFEKTITKVQSHKVSQSQDFEPLITLKGSGAVESSSQSQTSEINSEVDSHVTGLDSQVRSRIVVRKSQVQSKVTVVKSHATSSQWSKVTNSFDNDELSDSTGAPHVDMHQFMSNFGGNFDQFPNQGNLSPVFESVELDMKTKFE